MTEHLYMHEVHVERVGRSVKDETWTIEVGPCHPLNRLNLLAEEICKRARRHLLSNDVSVNVTATADDRTSGTFQVFAGFNNGGNGTWREVLEGCATAPASGQEATR